MRPASSRHLRRLLLLLVAVGSAGLSVAAYAAHLLQTLEGTTVDARFSIRGHQRPPSNVALVYIDAATFTDLRRQWPFPRAVHAGVLARIAADRPAAIAYDVEFPDPSQRGKRDDKVLLRAILNAGSRTVFSSTETNGKGNIPFLGSGQGTQLLHAVGARAGDAQFPLDAGGVTRRTSYAVDGLPTLAVVTSELATARHVDPGQFGSAGVWIDYYGPAGTFPAVSFSDVYRGRVARAFFTGKIVVVGASDPSLQAVADIHPTSTSDAMTGPEVQANAIETVLRGLPLRSWPAPIDVLLIVLLGSAVPLASLHVGPLAATVLALLLGALFTIAGQLSFDSGRVVAFSYPLGALALSGVGSLSVQLVSEAVERLRVRDLFSRFVPEDVVDEVLASADGLRLGGIEREATVMFTDLRGFTTFAESLAPERAIEVLNQYLSEMSDAILDHGGTLAAYMGDGIMAVFGAPLEQPDHADRALRAAREMLAVRLPRFNAWLRSREFGEGFRIGIGINTGRVMSGNVGSERRVEYTVIGDTTNAAARIEQLTKGTPHQLYLSEATRQALHDPPSDLVFVDHFELRGRSAPTGIWSVDDGDRSDN